MKFHQLSLLMAACLLSTASSQDAVGPAEDHYQTKEFPCPLAEDIAPCTCLDGSSGLSLFCNHYSVSDQQLSAVFQADFPVTDFYLLQIFDWSSGITMLGADLNTLTFQQIQVEVPSLAVISEDFLRANAETLEYLMIRSTLISESSFSFYDIESLPNLHYLDLGDNNFTSIDPITSESLQFLGLSNNKITSLEPDVFNGTAALKELYLGSNKIEMLSPEFFNGAEGLRVLNFGYNHLTELSPGIFDGLTSLQELTLDRNRISELLPASFIIPPSMINLYFSGNPLATIHPGSFVWPENCNLQRLYFDNNRIKEVLPGTFVIPPSLLYFNLYGNTMETIHPGAFVITPGTNLVPLRTSLEDNNLSAIEQDVFEGIFTRSTEVLLNSNPLLCGCDILWLINNTLHMEKLDTSSTCADGTPVHSLVVSEIAQSC